MFSTSGDGGFALRTMYLLTLVSPMSMPSLRSSPWMRGAPQAVVAAHPANQLASLGRHAGATATAMTGFPSPKETESLRCQPMTVSGSTMINAERQFRQACPEKPVRSDQLRPLDRALENIELVPKREHLNLKGGTAAKAIPRRCENGHNAEAGVKKQRKLNSQCINHIGICENHTRIFAEHKHDMRNGAAGDPGEHRKAGEGRRPFQGPRAVFPADRVAAR
jgi:hypothetical protein